MSAEQRATQSVEKYVDNKSQGSDASEALLTSANSAVSNNLDSSSMPSTKFDTELEKSGVLPKLAVDQFDKLNVDGEGDISKQDLQNVLKDKDGKYDPVTKLAAGHVLRNMPEINAANSWIPGVTDIFESKEDGISRKELTQYAKDQNHESVENDRERRNHQGDGAENLAADVGNYLESPKSHRVTGQNRIDQAIEIGGHLDGGPKEKALMRAMEKNGTAGKFIQDQLGEDAKEDGKLSREDLGKIASGDNNEPHAKRLAAKLALRNFERIDKADDGNFAFLSDRNTIHIGEIDAFAKANKGEGGEVVRQDQNTREASNAYGKTAETLANPESTKVEREQAIHNSNRELDQAGLHGNNSSTYKRGQRNAFEHNVTPKETATIAGQEDTFKRLAGEDNRITRDELNIAANDTRGKNFNPTERAAARHLEQNFDVASRGDSSITKGDLEVFSRGQHSDKATFAKASMDGTSSSDTAKTENTTSKDLASKVLDEDASGKERIEAAHELYKNGVKEFQYKVGENGKTETARISVIEGKNGSPDSLYVWGKDASGKSRPMLRSNIEQSKDGKLESVTKQGNATFEGTKWSDRVQGTSEKEASLVDVDKFESEEKPQRAETRPRTNEKSDTDSLASKVLDEDATGQERIEAAHKLLKSGVTNFQYKVGENGKTETARISIVEGKNGQPDSLYVWGKDASGRTRPMLRANIEQSNDGKLESVSKQGNASYEGSTWSNRIKRSGQKEAELVKAS